MTRKQSAPEVRIAAECYSLPLRLIHRVVTGIYDEALRPFGLRVAQLNLMVAIAKMGGQATAAGVGKFLLIEKSTLSRDLERMLQRGWIERASDGRSRRLHVTEEGRRLLERTLPAWEKAQSQAQRLLGKATMGPIKAAADRIRARKSRAG